MTRDAERRLAELERSAPQPKEPVRIVRVIVGVDGRELGRIERGQA